MALKEKPEVRELLTAAQATRNYCMLTGRHETSSEALIVALEPFDGNPNKLTPKHLTELRKAMAQVCRHIDDYTLTQILAGEPPVRIGRKLAVVQEGETLGDGHGWIARVIHSATTTARRHMPKIWQRFLLPVIAVLLLLSAIHYTQWTFNANLILSRLDQHVETDFHEQVRDLLVVAHDIDKNSSLDERSDTAGETLASDLLASTPAQRQFNLAMSQMKAFHVEDFALHTKGPATVDSFDILTAAWSYISALPDRLKREHRNDGNSQTLKASEGPDGLSTATGQSVDERDTLTDVVGEAPPSTANEPAQSLADTQSLIEGITEINEETSEEIKATRAAVENAVARATPPKPIVQDTMDKDRISAENWGQLAVALTSNNGFMRTVSQIAEHTGRFNPNNKRGDHVEARIEHFGIAEELKDKIALANRFLLPMIYGSLGAALFCLVRVLSPSLSDLGPGRTILRVLFGAFAAMTLSMLFIPANVFSINSQSNTTMIFLACFLFGYSFDAVLASLHRLEAWLHGRIKPTEGGG